MKTFHIARLERVCHELGSSLNIEAVNMETVLKKKELNKIAALAELDVRTVKKAYEGKSVHLSSWRIIRVAAEKLGMPTPKEHVPA